MYNLIEGKCKIHSLVLVVNVTNKEGVPQIQDRENWALRIETEERDDNSNKEYLKSKTFKLEFTSAEEQKRSLYL